MDFARAPRSRDNPKVNARYDRSHIFIVNCFKHAMIRSFQNRAVVLAAMLVVFTTPFAIITFLPTPRDNGGQNFRLVAQTGKKPDLSKQGSYRGIPWWSDRTVSVATLQETKFARCDVHTVLSEDGSSTINDWIFLEEFDAVNIVVHTLEGKFLVFKQRKYAIPGETLSPVGGFIDAGESPLTSARREVLEELGMGSRKTLEMVTKVMNETDDHNRHDSLSASQKMGYGGTFTAAQIKSAMSKLAHPPIKDSEYNLLSGEIPAEENDPDWIFLGRYRTAANRGGGFLYSYLLKNAVPLVANGGTTHYSSTGDDEQQNILHLSEADVMTAVSNGKFQEVKWAGTFALSLLHLKNDMPGCCSVRQ